MIIDQEFIDELKKLPYVDTKSCWLEVHRLIDRVYPRKIESSYYEDEYDYFEESKDDDIRKGVL